MQNKNKANNISVAGKKTTFIMERTNNTRNITPTIKDIISSTFFNLSASTNLYFSSFFFFIFDVFSEEELHQYYDSMEYLIVKEFAEKEEKHSSSQTDIILNQVISTFSSINFLLEKDKKSVESIRNAHHVKIENDFTDETSPKRKIIHLEGEVQIEVLPSFEDKEAVEEKTIKRRTNVWMVSGHLRHYKSGKVIFISSYPKGPERDKKKPKKKDYDLPQEDDE